MKVNRSGMPNRMTSSPVSIPRTARNHPIVALTSTMPGKVLPVCVVPLLREDAAKGGVSMALEMKETVDILMNDVNVVAQAWLFPLLASSRFRTMDDIDLAYTGNAREGDEPTPFIELAPFARPSGGMHQIHFRMGKHAREGQMVNQIYNEAYNAIWNYRAANVSPDIPLRDRLETSLAPAFWPQNAFSHVKADFDQAAMEGEVTLSIAEQDLRVRRRGDGGVYDFKAPTMNIGDLVAQTSDAQWRTVTTSSAGDGHLVVNGAPANQGIANLGNIYTDLVDVFAELRANSVTVSLANIKLAQETQKWAAIRKAYNQLPEQMLIDILMDGIHITEQGWRQPILLDQQSTKFGMAKRYAADGASLTEHVVNGAAALELRWQTPQVPCGGVIMVTLEIAPEQLFERQEDPYFVITDPERFPHAMPDSMRPEKVDTVLNGRVDVDHDNPNDVLGYEEMNARWNHAGPGIGGAYYRPEVDAPFDEERQAIWAVETQNPTLTKDFYLVPEDIHLKPFVTSLVDPFRVIANGTNVITGLTQFGGALIEATKVSDYDEVLKRVPQERIER